MFTNEYSDMATKYDLIIGVDPDVAESGVALLNVGTRTLTILRLRFPVAIEYCIGIRDSARKRGLQMCVVVESGWVNRPNWHIAGRSARAAAAIGKQTGRNHEVGRLLVETLQYHQIPVVEQPPLRKCWKGKDGKITADELKAFTGITGRTNQDERDAALLAWNYSGLPIRIVR